MYRILQFETLDMLSRIRLIKEFYDEGSFRIVKLFKNMGQDYDECELYCWESITDVSKNADVDYLYYEDETAINDESEAYGEVWIFSSDEMREYYKLLKKMEQAEKITSEEYIRIKKDIENCVARYVLDSQQENYYNGVGFELIDNGTENSYDCLKVYLDYNCCYSFFALYCGLVAVFDRYTNLLNELKGVLADKKEYWRQHK